MLDIEVNGVMMSRQVPFISEFSITFVTGKVFQSSVHILPVSGHIVDPTEDCTTLWTLAGFVLLNSGALVAVDHSDMLVQSHHRLPAHATQ